MSTQNQPLQYEQVSYNGKDGSQWGDTSNRALAFWGTTPASKLSNALTNISTTAFASTSGIYGFNTSTEGLQVTQALSTLVLIAKSLGISM